MNILYIFLVKIILNTCPTMTVIFQTFSLVDDSRMIFQMVLVLVSLVLSVYVVPFIQSTCLTSLSNTVLKDHVISSFSTSIINECWQACKDDGRCQSLNFFLKQQLCEINNRTIELAPKDAVQASYTSYFDNPYKGKIT